MAISFEKLPTDKPSQSKMDKGMYPATIIKAEMQKSKASGNEMLVVTFKTDGGSFVNEYYTDGDSTFVMYKIGRLLLACNLVDKLKGDGTLKDLSKVVLNKKVLIDVDINDKGYPNIDYSSGKDGLYPLTVAEPVAPVTSNLDPEIESAIEEDSDF